MMKLIVSLLFVFAVNALNISAGNQDKLSELRTQKKIIRMDKAMESSYSIQIVALREPPGEPEFFKKVNVAYEYPCADGYVRYCVGQFNNWSTAQVQLSSIKALGYVQAFVVNTRNYNIEGSTWSNYGAKEIDPDKIYTIQLSAFRFPVYLSHFKDIENVMEFRMKDKVFRYTVGKFLGSVVKDELESIKAMGYKDAYLVEFDKYAPFKIE